MRIICIPLIIGSAAALRAQAPAKANDRPAAQRATADTARMGNYDLEITTADGTMTGALKLSRGPAGIAAELQAGANKPDVKSFARENKEYVLTVGHGTFIITYRLKFATDSVNGSFRMSTGLTGTVAGARKP